MSTGAKLHRPPASFAGVDETWEPGKRVVGDGGVELATWDLGGDGPPLLLAHGTGFHAKMWEPLAGPLRSAYRVWALDHRGHGASGHAPDRDYSDWDRLARDLLAVADSVGGGGQLLGVGHSLGGAVALRAEQLRPGTFGALYCYEPVVLAPGVNAGTAELSMIARQRRAVWPSRPAAAANYARKPPFAAMDRRVLDAYVDHGLVERDDGTVALACPPDEEASFYQGAARASIWEHLGEVEIPVVVARGGTDVPPADLAEQIAGLLPAGTLQRFEDLDHFGPMTAPERVGSAIVSALDALGGRRR